MCICSCFYDNSQSWRSAEIGSWILSVDENVWPYLLMTSTLLSCVPVAIPVIRASYRRAIFVDHNLSIDKKVNPYFLFLSAFQTCVSVAISVTRASHGREQFLVAATFLSTSVDLCLHSSSTMLMCASVASLLMRTSYATIGGKFASLLALENQDTKIDTLINSFNTAVTKTANNILGKHRPAKMPWVTDNILKLCDKRRELKQKKNMTEGAKLYWEANQQVKKGMRKSKETWIEVQCHGIKENLQKKQHLQWCPNGQPDYRIDR